MNFIGCCNSAWILLWKIFLVQNFEDCFLENHFQIFLFLKSRFENSFECMHRLREARQSLVFFTVNGCLCSTTIPYREWKAWFLGLIRLALSCELSEWALSSFISFELGWGFKHWSHSCLARRPWCKVDGALYEVWPLEGAWSRFHHYQFLTKSSLLHDQPITDDQWGLCWLVTWPWG